MSNVLVTGGAGFIGSHTCLVLLEAGHQVVVVDNLSNSSIVSLQRVEALTGHSLVFIEADIRDEDQMYDILQQHHIDAVIHFAGLKAVGESQKFPLSYFEHNVAGSVSLFNAMQKAQVFQLVFSSSATVYGDDHASPLQESMPTGTPNNNYGYTKLVVEQMLQRLAVSDSQWSIALLRYFNPVGAHPSGQIGEDPQGIPNNLMPYVTQVAVGTREKLAIFGQDYDTVDGTGVRDYIHVMDLANAHVCALNNRAQHTGCRAWNIGTGRGYSVLEIKNAFEKVNSVVIPFEFVARRAGDVATCFSDHTRAVNELKWQPQYELDDMLKHSWHWQKNNPQGYRSK